MIHAFLWIKKRIRNHGEHKVAFLSVMDAINTSPLLDCQKPPVGYNISIYHNFTKEADLNLAKQWTCELCRQSFWRSTRGEPSAKDCIGEFNPNNSCGYPVCQWHRHRNHCSGRYIKSQDEVPGYRNEKTSNANSKPSGDGSASEQMCEDSKGKGLAVVFATRKRARPLESVKKPTGIGKRRKGCSERKAYNVIIQWLDLYTDEEEEEEEAPLVNNRTERRRKMRLLESQAKSTSC